MIKTTFLAALLSVMCLSLLSTEARSQMFAGYDSFCGIPVLVQPTDQTALATYDANGNPIIILDPGVYQNQTASRIFVIAHECGHHINGHLKGFRAFERVHGNATAKQERGADCWAAEQLAFLGLERELIRVIYEMAHSGAPTFGYPSGKDRAVTIQLCAMRAGADLPSYPTIVEGRAF